MDCRYGTLKAGLDLEANVISDHDNKCIKVSQDTST